jgi:hypothetical protein
MTRSRVLIVEDDRIVAMNLESIVLGAIDAEVLSVRTVGEARALVGPDLHYAFLERHVTDADTFDIAGALRSNGVPIAFLSRAEVEIAGDRPSLCKPFKPEQVRQALRDR